MHNFQNQFIFPKRNITRARARFKKNSILLTRLSKSILEKYTVKVHNERGRADRIEGVEYLKETD